MLTGPDTVTVPAGSLSATFTVDAGTSASNTSVLLTAVLNSSTQVLLLMVSGVVPAVPVISGIPAGVLDAGSYTPSVAQGGIFVVKGSNLCPDGVVQASSYPLANALNGTSISFAPAAGGTSVAPFMIYTYGQNGNSQLAAVLPSTAAPGTYNVTVTSNGVTSGAVSVSVVARKFGLVTADSSGSGAATLQIVDATGAARYNRFTTQVVSGNAIGPAHPGEFVVAFGTGLGAISLPDQSPPGVIDLRGQTKVQVLVGGEAIDPIYAGRSPGYPGLDQLNLQLPADVVTGCTVTIQVSVGGQVSNQATMSIAPVGSDVCSPAPVDATVLSRLDRGGSLTLGNFWLSQLTTSTTFFTGVYGNVNESAFGSFVKYSGSQLGSAAALMAPSGSCQVSRIMGNSAQLVFGPVSTYLDAGNVTLAGPGMSSAGFGRDASTRTYSLPLGAASALGVHLPLGFPSFNVSPAIKPGTYHLTGEGGADVGIFTAAVTVGQPLTVAGGLPMSVDRSTDLTLAWEGGNPGDVVVVTGISGTIIGGTTAAPVYDAGRLTCTASASARSITIPASLLKQLPVTPPALGGIGYLGVSWGPQPAPGDGAFTAPLTLGGGIDAGLFAGALGAFGITSYQ